LFRHVNVYYNCGMSYIVFVWSWLFPTHWQPW